MGLEPLMDSMIGDFCEHLEKRFMNATTNPACDLGEWIAYCMYSRRVVDMLLG